MIIAKRFRGLMLVLAALIYPSSAIQPAVNPCRAGEKRVDLQSDSGTAPWRLYNVCIFQSKADGPLNSTVSFQYIDKNPEFHISTHCEYIKPAGFAVANSLFWPCENSSVSWSFGDWALTIGRSWSTFSIGEDTFPAGFQVGKASVDTWEVTETGGGTYMHMRYQEIMPFSTHLTAALSLTEPVEDSVRLIY